MRNPSGAALFIGAKLLPRRGVPRWKTSGCLWLPVKNDGAGMYDSHIVLCIYMFFVQSSSSMTFLILFMLVISCMECQAFHLSIYFLKRGMIIDFFGKYKRII